MNGTFISFLIATALASLISCHTGKQPATTTTNNLIVGKHWKLVEVNGETIQPGDQVKREPHMILNASEKRVNGNGGCNSFFGSYELQGDNSLTFSKIGSTKMACANGAMQVEQKLFKALEMANQYTVRNDTLFLIKADMSQLVKFVVSKMN